MVVRYHNLQSSANERTLFVASLIHVPRRVYDVYAVSVSCISKRQRAIRNVTHLDESHNTSNLRL